MVKLTWTRSRSWSVLKCSWRKWRQHTERHLRQFKAHLVVGRIGHVTFSFKIWPNGQNHLKLKPKLTWIKLFFIKISIYVRIIRIYSMVQTHVNHGLPRLKLDIPPLNPVSPRFPIYVRIIRIYVMVQTHVNHGLPRLKLEISTPNPVSLCFPIYVRIIRIYAMV